MTLTGGPFRDREDAGRQLAQALRPELAGQADTILLGLPRGGAVVAAVIAAELALTADVLVVRKIGSPRNPELAVGAVTADGTLLVNERVVQAEELDGAQVDSLVAAAATLAATDQARYRDGRAPPSLAGRQVVVVDDGAATGATVRAAVLSVRASGAARVVVALPVAPAETLAVLQREADAVVCLRRPLLFRAVGWAYEDFAPTSTERVLELFGGR
jgi:putative phosphoribosyl transferase